MHRFFEEKLETKHGVEHCLRAVYIRVTEKSLTMLDPTGLAIYHTSLLMWYLGTQIG